MVGSSVGLAHVLAHQGGWDEMALVAGPIVVIIALLAVVKRRVDGAASNASNRSTASTTDDAGRVHDDR